MRTAWRVSGSILLIALCAGTLRAQPFVFYRGIVNAASFAPPGLPNGSIARGSIFSIFGRDLGPVGSPPLAFPLQTTLGGVSVEVCQGGNCMAAIPLFVSPGQINAVMPSNAPLGGVSIRVTHNGQAGNFSPGAVAASSLGIFTVNSAGFGPGIVQNFVAQDNEPLNSAVATARPGQVVTLWGTGLGPGLNADNAMPQAGNLPVEVEIFVGGKRVTNKLYSGRTPCCAGVDQIIFSIPADAPSGCYVPVAIRTAGEVVSSDVTMAISADGDSCSDPNEPAGEALRRSGSMGVVSVLRGRSTTSDGQTIGADFASALFTEEAGGPWAFQAAYVSPPEGACIVYEGRGAQPETTAAIAYAPPVRELDAGELVLAAAGTELVIARQPPLLPGYLDFLGRVSPLPGESSPSLLEPPGAVRLLGAGGADVGAFDVAVTFPPAPLWTNRDAVAAVDRRQDLTLTWTPPAADQRLWVAGAAADAPRNAQAQFLCPVDASRGSFTVGSEVLRRLPAGEGYVALLLVAPADGVEFPAAGVAFATASAASALTQSMEYH